MGGGETLAPMTLGTQMSAALLFVTATTQPGFQAALPAMDQVMAARGMQALHYDPRPFGRSGLWLYRKHTLPRVVEILREGFSQDLERHVTRVGRVASSWPLDRSPVRAAEHHNIDPQLVPSFCRAGLLTTLSAERFLRYACLDAREEVQGHEFALRRIFKIPNLELRYGLAGMGVGALGFGTAVMISGDTAPEAMLVSCVGTVVVGWAAALFGGRMVELRIMEGRVEGDADEVAVITGVRRNFREWRERMDLFNQLETQVNPRPVFPHV